MKHYFLQFDFWNMGLNKFFYGPIKADLNKTTLPEVCQQVIRDNFPDVCIDEIKIKVNAFNNIEI